MEAFLATVCTSAWNSMLDAGVSFAAAVAERIAAFPEWEAEIRAYDERWQDMVAGPIPGPVACLRSLKAAGYPVFAISNFSAEELALERRRRDFLMLFDGVVLSADIGILKPDAGIDRHFCRTYGRSAAGMPVHPRQAGERGGGHGLRHECPSLRVSGSI